MKYLIVLLFSLFTLTLIAQPTYKTTINVDNGTGGSGGLDSIVYISNKLSSDVTMASAVTWYNGPSVTLGAGTWLVNTAISLSSSAGGSPVNIGFRISDGTNHHASTYSRPDALFQSINISMTTILSLESETTIYTQGMSSSTTEVLKAVTSGATSGNNDASQINAIKLSN